MEYLIKRSSVSLDNSTFILTDGHTQADTHPTRPCLSRYLKHLPQQFPPHAHWHFRAQIYTHTHTHKPKYGNNACITKTNSPCSPHWMTRMCTQLWKRWNGAVGSEMADATAQIPAMMRMHWATAGMLSSCQHEKGKREKSSGKSDRQREAIPVPDQKGAEEGGTKL